MTKRLSRIGVLRMLLNTQALGKLDDILTQLALQGIHTSIGTLSNDLHQLRVAKVHTPDGQRYVLPDHPLYRRTVNEDAIPTTLRGSGFRRLSFSGNLCIIRTQSGYAAAIAADIDAAELNAVAGTVAGSDTLFVAIAEGVPREEFVDELAKVLPAVKAGSIA